MHQPWELSVSVSILWFQVILKIWIPFLSCMGFLDMSFPIFGLFNSFLYQLYHHFSLWARPLLRECMRSGAFFLLKQNKNKNKPSLDPSLLSSYHPISPACLFVSHLLFTFNSTPSIQWNCPCQNDHDLHYAPKFNGVLIVDLLQSLFMIYLLIYACSFYILQVSVQKSSLQRIFYWPPFHPFL